MNEINKIRGNQRFNTRIFVSFGVFLSFIAAAASGIILYLRPEGSLASWAAWRVLGVDKKGWEGLHIVSIALFVLFAAAHILYNGKALLGYIRRQKAGGTKRRMESAAALAVVLLVLAGAVARRGPAWKLTDLRAGIKNGIHLIKVRPPAPNAEEMAIRDLCALAGVRVEEAIGRLEAAGLSGIAAETTLADLAGKSGQSPEKLYALITKR